MTVPVDSRAGRTMTGNVRPLGDGDDRRLVTFSELNGDPLFPGIPNEITIDEIVPKLSWKDVFILSLVNRAWSQAIRSRHVYETRVRTHSTETLALLLHTPSDREKFNAIVLYSMKDNSCYRLPPIPHVAKGIPDKCRCVSMDGKVYILGVETKDSNHDGLYVFDMAGQKAMATACKDAKKQSRFRMCCPGSEDLDVWGWFWA